MIIDLDQPRELKFTLESLEKLQDLGINIPMDMSKGYPIKTLINCLYFGLRSTDQSIKLEDVKNYIEDYGYIYITPLVDAAIMECLSGKKNLKNSKKPKEGGQKNQ